MLSQYTGKGLWGVFSELLQICCSGGMGSDENRGEPKLPGLAVVTASSCPSVQEQGSVVQWRWGLSHASKLHSGSKCVEGFSTVWEQVL